MRAIRHESLLKIIDGLRATDPAIASVFNNGGCYQFAKYLQTLYPQGALKINLNRDHVRFAIDGMHYDIEGAHMDTRWWYEIDEQQIKQCEQWSFSKQRMIQIGECPACDEPLVA